MRSDVDTATPADGFDIPNVTDHPEVLELHSRFTQINADRAAVARRRADLESELNVRPGVAERDVRASLLARGQSTEAVAELAKLREQEADLGRAAELVSAELKAATEKARRELSADVGAELLHPAEREAAALYLRFVAAATRADGLMHRLRVSRLSVGLSTMFGGGSAPVLACEAGGIVRELIRRGLVEQSTVKQLFPNGELHG